MLAEREEIRRGNKEHLKKKKRNEYFEGKRKPNDREMRVTQSGIN